jgi:hypothetical protein
MTARWWSLAEAVAHVGDRDDLWQALFRGDVAAWAERLTCYEERRLPHLKKSEFLHREFWEFAQFEGLEAGCVVVHREYEDKRPGVLMEGARWYLAEGVMLKAKDVLRLWPPRQALPFDAHMFATAVEVAKSAPPSFTRSEREVLVRGRFPDHHIDGQQMRDILGGAPARRGRKPKQR